nr:hypothetical protein [Tanacetum cinerariifolium]
MAESSSAPRRSERARKEKNLDLDFIDSEAIIFPVEGDNENNVVNKIPVLLNVEDAPKTYKEAITSRNSAFWKEAIDDEMNSLVSNNTWELSDLPQVPKQLGVDGYLELNTIQMDPFKLLKLDDILIVGTNMEGINETKKFLSSCFQMKDMNEVDTILGIKVKRHSEGYALNQCHSIDKIIDKFQHLNIEEANTPYELSCKLVENNGRAVAQIEYASAIGYSDASWITGSSDSKSTTGWIFTLGGGAIYWGSKKQTCITHSTMEANFLALAAAGKGAEWLRNMLLDIELWPQPMSAISLHCDSQSTLSRAYNKGFTYVDISSGAAPTKETLLEDLETDVSESELETKTEPDSESEKGDTNVELAEDRTQTQFDYVEAFS